MKAVVSSRAESYRRIHAMKLSTVVVSLFVVLLGAGCASTKVTNQEHIMIGLLPKPTHIWVYDFVATAADVPTNSALAGDVNLDPTPQTEQQIAEGRQLGTEIA